jgi:uncharacterized protein (TIGR02186 family)
MNARPALSMLIVGAIIVCLTMRTARAEQLVLIPSTTEVLIRSNYVGASVALFGAVQDQGALAQEDPVYDVVVTVTGPPQTLVTRRKSRFLGIWANAESRTFNDAPSYLEVLANRRLDSIAGPRELTLYRIGLDHALPPSPAGRDAPFRAALISLESEQGDYAEKVDAITFFSPTLFRAVIVLPARAQVGTYSIEAKLFTRGSFVAQARSSFTVEKGGLVQYIAAAAHNHGLLYGLTTTAMALAMGWIASIIFQRE